MIAALVFAHAGHWAVNLLYTAPLLAVVGIIVRDRLRERRGENDEATDEDGQPAGP